MEFAAQRLARVKPSATMAISAQARALIGQGRDIVRMGAGEPDFPTPPHIQEAAIAAIRDGQTRYTGVGGTPALKEAILRKLRRDNGLRYDRSEVTASAGGKQIVFNALLATLNPGDEVLIPAPYWVSYVDMVELCQAVPKIIPCPEDQGYLPTADQLRAAIGPQSRILILNSPCNPTGSAFESGELMRIAEVVLGAPGLLVISDDLYEHITYDGFAFRNLPMLAEELRSRTLVVNGVSKAYSMTGWRLGYGAGPADLIRNMETIQGQSTSNPCSVSQAAAVAALSGSQECVWEMRAAFDRRRRLALGLLAEIPEVSVVRPKGAFYLFPKVARLYALPAFQSFTNGEPRSVAFCNHLLNHHGVAAVPGAAFGADECIRISYALADEALEKGISRLAEFVATLRD